MHAAKSNGKRFTDEEVKATPKHLVRETIQKTRKAMDMSEKGAPPPSARHSRLAKLPSHTAAARRAARCLVPLGYTRHTHDPMCACTAGCACHTPP